MAAAVISPLHIILTTFLLLSSFSEAANQILVGGKKDAWKIPTESDSLNAWAANSRFRIGDSLVWTYDSDKDSVLQVTREGYLNCNTSSPIKEYTGGNTTVKLEKSGPHYFISGAEGHCNKGEKLIVVVLTPRHNKKSTPISPAPSPVAEVEGPVVAPSPTSRAASSLKGGMAMGLVGILVLVAMF